MYMESVNPSLNFLLNLARFQTVMTRRFDGRIGVLHGLGLSDFLILHHLSEAPGEKLRRIDLAEKVGLTASGVTRLLAPKEKIGLIIREANAQDARVSLVSLAPGGKALFENAMATANVLAEDVIPSDRAGEFEPLLRSLIQASRSFPI
jgi:DNA-binding MarR family transcriptional regulator